MRLVSSRSSGSLRIIVLGYVVRGPMGGLAWHHLHYVVGLSRLGHEVIFIEDSDDYPSCYDPSRHVTSTDPSYGLTFIATAFQRLGLPPAWGFFDAHAGVWHGPAASDGIDILKSADLLLDVSGVNPIRPWMLDIPHRVLIDTDPAFTQISHLRDETALSRAVQHTAFFSFGENIERGTASVPDDGFTWQATRQPVVLDLWPAMPPQPSGMFTTVMQWESYKEREHDGAVYGMKSKSFLDYLDLPRLTGQAFELALGSPDAPRDLLADKGWRLENPLDIAEDPWTYQRYIQASKAEFTVAKQAYAMTNSGWFSERSANYLASARPVVTQDTGFDGIFPTGRGLLSFRTCDEAVASIAEINARYFEHCQAARELAAAYFDSNLVLSDLLTRIYR
jgi:hypothetical protein